MHTSYRENAQHFQGENYQKLKRTLSHFKLELCYTKMEWTLNCVSNFFNSVKKVEILKTVERIFRNCAKSLKLGLI